jgi:hypothetical protein
MPAVRILDVRNFPTRFCKNKRNGDFSFVAHVFKRSDHFGRVFFRLGFSKRELFDVNVLRVVKGIEVESTPLRLLMSPHPSR